jgi:hypothetical protein
MEVQAEKLRIFRRGGATTALPAFGFQADRIQGFFSTVGACTESISAAPLPSALID